MVGYVRPHLIAAGPDGGSDPGSPLGGIAGHLVQGGWDDSAGDSPPARVDGRNFPRSRDEHRDAVGRHHGEREAALSGIEGVTLAAGPRLRG